MTILLAVLAGALAIFSVAIAAQNHSSPNAGWNEFEKGFASAFRDYDAARDGTISMEGPAEIERGAYGTWRFTYRAGSAGIAPGGGIKVTFRHLAGWGVPQDIDPGGVDFTTAAGPKGVPIHLEAEETFQIWNKYFLRFFPWQHVSGIEMKQRLSPGETLTLTFGDKSFGSPGFRAPSLARDRAWFMAFVDVDGSGNYIPIHHDLYVRTLAGPPDHLNVILPSQTVAGQPTRVQVRVEDDQGNMASQFRGTVQLSSNDPQSTLPATYTFTAADQGVHWFEDVRFLKTGVLRVEARDPALRLSVASNPMVCATEAPPLKIEWGELHGHTIFSDGTGTVQQYFQYGRDIAALDFLALSDHAELLDPVRWKIIEDDTTRFYQPHRFVTIYGYEWGGLSPEGGHHNVYFLHPDVPLYRSSNSQNDINPWLYYGGPNVGAGHVARLFQKLDELPDAKRGEIVVIPHWRGATATPEWGDPNLQREIEVASEAGYHEQWAQTFFTPGSHVGFIGSSDDHYGRPGYGLDDRFEDPWRKTRLGSPVTAVLAPEKTRESIFKGLYDRHVYATTGERILLRFDADGHLMGDEYVATQSPVFHVFVAGTTALKTVEIKRLKSRAFEVTDPFPDMREHAQVIHEQQLHDGQKDVEFNVQCKGCEGTAFYYLHVVQQDGEQAVSSPIRIEVK